MMHVKLTANFISITNVPFYKFYKILPCGRIEYAVKSDRTNKLTVASKLSEVKISYNYKRTRHWLVQGFNKYSKFEAKI